MVPHLTSSTANPQTQPGDCLPDVARAAPPIPAGMTAACSLRIYASTPDLGTTLTHSTAHPLCLSRRRPEATALVQQMQHGELRPGEVQDLLSKARAELKAAEAAGNGV